MNLAKKKDIQAATIISIVGLAAVLFAIGILVYYICREFHPAYANIAVTIYAAIAGGVCTLAGVLISIRFDHLFQKESDEEKLKPDFYIPKKFVLGNNIDLFLSTSPLNGKRIPNHHHLFKNTDKNNFKIEKIEYDGKFFNEGPFYVEKGMLVYVHFYHRAKSNKNLRFFIKSLDDADYIADINLDAEVIDVKRG